MVLVPVLSLIPVVRGVSVLFLLHRPDPFLKLDQASDIWGDVVLLAARWRRLVTAVLLILVGHHLLDAYHWLSLADQRHLVGAMMEKKNVCLNHLQ